ncbi:heparin lyase I family protein [Maribellus sediminis]|uniref:heparin lyase I family protein n=1 Tax=Maribellus sediminis TaxID=2696285 RepID=UPI001431E791|nr:heparin lyase I family protein [Maribellus sediminis]
MKKIITSFPYSVLLLIIYAAPVKSQVIWYGDPNQGLRDVFYRFDITGYTSGEYCVDNVTADPTMSTPTDSIHGKHWEIFKPANRKRAEFARTKGFIPQENGEYYFGWRWKISSSPSLNKGIAVFQCKTEAGTNKPSTQNYPFTLEYDGTNLALACFGPGYPDWSVGSSITNRKTTIWRQAVPQDKWVTFVFHVNFSRDESVGFIEFWYNGEQQTLMNSNYKEYQVTLSDNNKRAYHKTNDGNQVYFKWGSYGKNACEFNITTKYDEMRVTHNFEEVAD